MTPALWVLIGAAAGVGLAHLVAIGWLLWDAHRRGDPLW